MSMIMEQHQFSSSRVANPLAASSSNEIDFAADSAKGSSAVGGAAGTTTPLGVPNPISGGVPNPIMDASPSTAAVNYNNTTTTTTTAPFPMVSKEASAPPTAPFTSTTPMTSLVPSPLASPSASPSHQQDNDDDMETMRDTSCDEPPKKEQRRQRSNTIQWAIGDTDNNSKQQESFEPVNFGDYRDKSPRKDSVGSWASCASHDTSSTTQSPTPLSPADHLLHDVGVVDPVSVVGTSSTSATAATAAAGGPAFPLGFAASSDAATTSTTCTTTVANKQASSSAVPIVDKRQKRLERNRESARASRRRRKQYLEELESNVHNLSTDMDSGRMLHALEGVKVVAGMRKGKVLKILELLNGTTASDVGGDIDMNDASRGGRSIIATKTSSGVKHNVIPKTTVPLPPTTQQQPQQPQSLQGLLQHTNTSLTTSLSRTQPSFQVVNTFFQQQLKSLILTHKQPITSATPNPAAAALSTSGSPILGPLLPSLTPFLLWLTLQNDDFFRGGRAQSERLSAARIGERLLHGGLYRVTPSTTGNKSAQHNDNKGGGGGRVLWPLLCHEIGLSYDQEDKIRTAQRLVLQNVDLWVHRHTARATSNVIQSVHDIIGGMMELTQQKYEIENGTAQNEAAGLKTDDDADESLMSILTEEQRVKFLGWALKNQERMKRCAERNVGKNVAEVGELGVSKERHVAANMYIIDHKLGKVKQRVPPVAGKYVNPSQLKKLGRRPCFESLGGYDKDNNDVETSTKKMSRNDSAGSLLKRSLDDMSLGGTSSGLDTNVTAVTPEAAQAAGHAAASVFLKDVLPIIPAPPIQYQHPQQLQEQSHAQHFEPESVMSAMPASVMSASFPSQPQQQHLNAASSTFDDIPMPTPVSVLLQTPDDFLNPSDGGVNDNDMMGGVDPTAAIDPIPFVPEPVASSSISMMSRHQSAPEFGQYLGSPTAPIGMVPVPEGEDEDDFGILDDLPMDADDWLIGDDTLEF
eukprot:CAMPEP_0113428116 /NCGR_PEP_ID=MMETSP0013_2-20120614/31690_1 /TAXON_ID=2843 ORGANISM="Skeletonema costatum, Strain 1716" /NCGR_SAMPLE_ID=MMETSP0013_2 /ASSEMBLY_ACC=CAM_ASM_000158 /LENGTH=976 /DNA_ID=CAMNT_0000316641 /DNA_START=1 /DNA_END=2931 /DNA_ORIENTATION=+ /assembly_acc=CAM_ASM_000158